MLVQQLLERIVVAGVVVGQVLVVRVKLQVWEYFRIPRDQSLEQSLADDLLVELPLARRWVLERPSEDLQPLLVEWQVLHVSSVLQLDLVGIIPVDFDIFVLDEVPHLDVRHVLLGFSVSEFVGLEAAIDYHELVVICLQHLIVLHVLFLNRLFYFFNRVVGNLFVSADVFLMADHRIARIVESDGVSESELVPVEFVWIASSFQRLFLALLSQQSSV